MGNFNHEHPLELMTNQANNYGIYRFDVIPFFTLKAHLFSEESKTARMNQFFQNALIFLLNGMKKSVLLIMMLTLFCLFPWRTLVISVLDFQAQPAIKFSKSLSEVQFGLCHFYQESKFFESNLEPWLITAKSIDLKSSYIKQSFQTLDGFTTEDMLDLFSWNDKNSFKRLLLVAEQGEGKTTAIKYASMTWCDLILRDDYQFDQKLSYQREYLIGQSSQIFSNGIIQDILDSILMPMKLKPIPELFLAFELKDICSYNSIKDILIVNSKLPPLDVEEIMNKLNHKILYAFDGYDEFTKVSSCPNIIKSEVDSIIGRKGSKGFNVIVTSRPWRSYDLLSVHRLGYEKLTFLQRYLHVNTRNKIIVDFFSDMDQDLSKDLIVALESQYNIIPSTLLHMKRMLLYICEIYTYNFYNNSIADFFDKDRFLENLWELMRLTYNMKYPSEPMSKDALVKMRNRIGQLKTTELSYEELHDVFGDETTFDIFYFGIYSTEIIENSGNKKNLAAETIVIKETPGLDELPQEERNKQKGPTNSAQSWRQIRNILSISNLFLYLLLI